MVAFDPGNKPKFFYIGGDEGQLQKCSIDTGETETRPGTAFPPPKPAKDRSGNEMVFGNAPTKPFKSSKPPNAAEEPSKGHTSWVNSVSSIESRSDELRRHGTYTSRCSS